MLSIDLERRKSDGVTARLPNVERTKHSSSRPPKNSLGMSGDKCRFGTASIFSRFFKYPTRKKGIGMDILSR